MTSSTTTGDRGHREPRTPRFSSERVDLAGLIMARTRYAAFLPIRDPLPPQDRALTDAPYFLPTRTWASAEKLLAFRPRRPRLTGGCRLRGLRVHVRDHKGRELASRDRSLEAHFGRFVVTQARKGASEARRWALLVAYGPQARPAEIAGHEGRLYELGPDPPAGDPDGRSPAVVTWHDGEMFYLVASGELHARDLMPIAESMYGVRPAR